jgi:hypothetical protein
MALTPILRSASAVCSGARAHLLALVVKSRFGDEGWECHNFAPSGGVR